MPEVLTFMLRGSTNDASVSGSWSLSSRSASVGSVAPWIIPAAMLAAEASIFAEKKTTVSVGVAGGSGMNSVCTGSGPPAPSPPSAVSVVVVDCTGVARSSA
ncbi:hypothetical protein D3C85_1284810 [compost metagenome]